MSNVISKEYQQLQIELHKNPNYGVASLGYAPTIARIILENGISSVSDYGAGKCNLQKGLTNSGIKTITYMPYDPAFPEYGPFNSAELICCIDVLEHIEPEHLESVLDHLSSKMIQYGFFTIHTGPAEKTLSDGRNAHLIQQPCSWWLDKLCKKFEVYHLQQTDDGKGFWLVLSIHPSKQDPSKPLKQLNLRCITSRPLQTKEKSFFKKWLTRPHGQ